jgi:hypothetical protein
MRKHFLGLVLASVPLAAVVLCGAATGSKAKRDEPAAKMISGSGCVTAGVEGGCLMVTDTRTGKVYNVFFGGKKPNVGTAIRFSGKAHDGPTMCMQGQAVDVTSWTKLKMKCKRAN